MNPLLPAYAAVALAAGALHLAIWRPRSARGLAETVAFGALWPAPLVMAVAAAFSGLAVLRETRETPPWRPADAAPGHLRDPR